MDKKKMKKGAGEAIGFTFAILFLMFFLMVVLSLYNYMKVTEKLSYALQELSRGLVVCEDIDEAQSEADAFVNNYFSKNSIYMPKDKIKVYVDYANGTEPSWYKGNYITISLSAYVNNLLPLTSSTKEVSQLVMIENDGQTFETSSSSSATGSDDYAWEDYGAEGDLPDDFLERLEEAHEKEEAQTESDGTDSSSEGAGTTSADGS